jgi:hypothetical protein
MKHSTKPPTKSEAARFAKLKALGCVACLKDGRDMDELMPPEIHHQLRGGRRIGHEATIPLCYWHHQGLPYDEVPASWFLATLGPSFDKHKFQFRQRYGSDEALLAYVNEQIGENA